MKCWIIQKLIPMYIDEHHDILHNAMEHHCKHCIKCQQIYSKYKNIQNILHSFQTKEVPQHVTNNYWNDLAIKINQLPKPEQQTIPSYSLFWQPILGFAIILFVFFIGYLVEARVSLKTNTLQPIQTIKQNNISNNSKPYVQKKTYNLHSIPVAHHILDTEKDNDHNNIRKFNQRIIETIDCQLDQVELVQIEHASF
ncbi:MAG: hypothetical protein KBC30_00320 [Planctomycetes bacterium]|nr:hypothetical protein [Planctomycetota bacterium]HPY73835.1 hypothetical protein [Planctomycetota bacterium]HQA99463.1 hypothetical protein [Planctomycetota bacterium]